MIETNLETALRHLGVEYGVQVVAQAAQRLADDAGHWRTVPICTFCWEHFHPDGRVPVKMLNPDREQCYRCGRDTVAGIYVRALVADDYGGDRP